MKEDPGAVGRPLVIGGGLLIAAWILWDGRNFWPSLIRSQQEVSVVLGRLLRFGALASMIVGSLVLSVAWRRWRRSSPEPLPREVWFAMLMAAGFLLLDVLMQMSSTIVVVAIVMPIPVLIAVLSVRKSLQSRKAEKWAQTSARITRSEVQVRHHHFLNDVTQVTNVPAVEYEFSIGPQTFHGSRVGFGEVGEANLQDFLKRFPKGAVVPVFYDPASPHECVLERDLPVSRGCIWAIAATGLLVGGVAVVAVLHLEEIDTLLTRLFPSSAPVFTIVFGGGGVLMLMILWVSIKQAVAASRWPVAEGRVVSSTTESFKTRVGGAHTGQLVTFYQAVVEYSYRVDGRDYHGTRLSFGGKQSTAEGPAKRKAARYPSGSTVQVRYDPADPSQAVLETRVALSWLLLVASVVFLGLAVRFSGVFR
jgi:hypothetical protein